MIIKTPSRLHLTLIDLNGSCGRIDGGVGITIRDPELVLRLEHSDNDKGINIYFKESDLSESLIKDYSQKIEKSALNLLEYLKLNKVVQSLDLDGGYNFFVERSYPAHSGLGSGTQLSLATAKLLSALNGVEIKNTVLGQIVGRGGTSGIGV